MMKKSVFTFLFASALLLNTAVFAQDGQQIYKTNCAVCHTIGKGQLVGPDLKKVGERYEEGWLIKWIQSSQTLIQQGDPLAVELTAKNPAIMPDMPLNEEEVKAVLAYIEEQSEDKPAEAAPAPATTTTPAKRPAAAVTTPHKKTDTTVSPGTMNLIIGSVFILMVLIIAVLASVIQKLTAALRNK